MGSCSKLFFAQKQPRSDENRVIPVLTFYAAHFAKHNSVLQID
jgi:hypothetical protein